MTKIVVNRCYGGFQLSPTAQKRYLELIGKKCFFYKHTKYSFDNDNDEYTRISLEDAEELSYCETVTEDLGEVTPDIGGHRNTKHPNAYWYYGNIERDDPNLIKVIEELGSSIASGKLSELEIVDIPDDVEYEITDYDGIESVHECHRSW